MGMNSTLKLAIFNSGHSQIEIAKKVGIHETRLSKIVRGHVEPSADEQRVLARVLRKPAEELFAQQVA
jgi:transcriptional regulator with XRE-family HTH domain